MGLTVHIDTGRIVILHPQEGEVKGFTDQSEAAAYAGYHIANKALPIDFVDSARAPEKNGRPGFRVEDFKEEIQDAIYRIQQSMRSMST